MADNLTKPEYWRARAEEARTLAADMKDAEARDAMLGVAAGYEKIAAKYAALSK